MRPTLSRLIFAALVPALLAAPAPAAAESEGGAAFVTREAGAAGGGASERLLCPPNTLLTGFIVHGNDALEGIQVRCHAVSATGAWEGPEITGPRFRDTGRWAGNLGCEPDTYVAAFSASIEAREGDRVATFQFSCVRLDHGGVWGTRGSRSGGIGFVQQGNPEQNGRVALLGDYGCPSRWAANGVAVRGADNGIDRFGLICEQRDQYQQVAMFDSAERSTVARPGFVPAATEGSRYRGEGVDRTAATARRAIEARAVCPAGAKLSSWTLKPAMDNAFVQSGSGGYAYVPNNEGLGQIAISCNPEARGTLLMPQRARAPQGFPGTIAIGYCDPPASIRGIIQYVRNGRIELIQPRCLDESGNEVPERDADGDRAKAIPAGWDGEAISPDENADGGPTACRGEATGLAGQYDGSFRRVWLICAPRTEVPQAAITYVPPAEDQQPPPAPAVTENVCQTNPDACRPPDPKSTVRVPVTGAAGTVVRPE